MDEQEEAEEEEGMLRLSRLNCCDASQAKGFRSSHLVMHNPMLAGVFVNEDD